MRIQKTDNGNKKTESLMTDEQIWNVIELNEFTSRRMESQTYLHY